MPIRIAKGRTAEDLIERISKLSGVNISACLQCKKCGNGCPAAEYSASPPSEIIKRLQAGAGDELLDSDIIWNCVSCETCYGRCPMKINMAEVMDALRITASARGAAKPAGNSPLMTKILLRTIKTFGRTYDLGAMLLYKIGTSTYFRDMGKTPAIFAKRKIALLPPRGTDTKTVKRIFKNYESARKV